MLRLLSCILLFSMSEQIDEAKKIITIDNLAQELKIVNDRLALNNSKQLILETELKPYRMSWLKMLLSNSINTNSTFSGLNA